MNYIDVIKALWKWYCSSILEPNDYCLMMRLIAISNDDMGWGDCFLRNNQELCGYTKLSYKQITNSRNKLQQIGLISFEQRNGVTNCRYQIHYETLLNLSEIGKGLAKVGQRFGKGDGVVKINKTKLDNINNIPSEETFIEPKNEEEKKEPPVAPPPQFSAIGELVLSESELMNARGYVDRVSQLKLSDNEALVFLEAFNMQYSGEFYANRNKKVQHFQNWLKTQKKANGTGTNYNGNGRDNGKNGGLGILANGLAEELREVATRRSSRFGNEI